MNVKCGCYIVHTLFPCKHEASSWVFTLVVALHSKLRKNDKVTKYFTLLMAARERDRKERLALKKKTRKRKDFHSIPKENCQWLFNIM
jgi:hypothetical protein